MSDTNQLAHFMKQEKIFELLKKASQTEDTTEISKIISELKQSAPDHDRAANPELTEMEHEFEEGRSEETRNILGRVFHATYESRPHLLPSLFPLFASCCGDKEENSICADVDWSVID